MAAKHIGGQGLITDLTKFTTICHQLDIDGSMIVVGNRCSPNPNIICLNQTKLDGVGPIDNRPFPTSSTPSSKFF